MNNIHSMRDPEVIKLIEESPQGVNPYYHALGTLGGIAVREKYKDKATILRELQSKK